MYKTRLGHFRLKVRDLDRAVEFYTHFLNLSVSERVGNEFAFLTCDDSHHVLALEGCGEKAHLPAPENGRVDHIAFEVPGRKSFARAFNALSEAGVKTSTISNGISWSIYFEDPDRNPLEIFCDIRHEPDGQEMWGGMRRALKAEEITSVLTAPKRYVVPDTSRP